MCWAMCSAVCGLGRWVASGRKLVDLGDTAIRVGLSNSQSVGSQQSQFCTGGWMSRLNSSLQSSARGYSPLRVVLGM